ncbi:hypothetical protein LTR95_001386 [Oleoguttula sp. CCFEE 5521]
MFLDLSRSAIFALALFDLASAANYDFDIGWVNTNPDGRQPRPVIAINGRWPNPEIRVSKGETILVNAKNNLGNESTSLHWHGFFQRDNNQYDGPVGVTQCPIPPGSSFQYEVKATRPGTYWYHSHSAGQSGDGLRGPLIVEDPDSPYNDDIDDELPVMTLSDWYHDQIPPLIDFYQSTTANPDGGEPVPYSLLMNDATTAQFKVKPKRTYLLRIINVSAFAQIFLAIDQHNMTIIEADGTYTKPMTVQHLYISTAQRYSVLIRTHDKATQNFAILGMMDTGAFDDVPGYLDTNVTGHLVYDSELPLPSSPSVPVWQLIDDLALEPISARKALGPVDHKVALDLDFFTDFNENRAGFNGITYVPPLVPTLYTVLSAPKDVVQDARIYGNHSNSYVLKKNEIVEVTITNSDDGFHPLHIHGHAPQIISRTTVPVPAGAVVDSSGITHSDSNPMRRDVWMLAPNGATTIRFKADNPGVWLLHCHMDAGLSMTFIEAPKVLQNQQSRIDPAMKKLCAAQKISTVGNAGGNSKDWLDLSNAPTTATGRHGALYP